VCRWPHAVTWGGPPPPTVNAVTGARGREASRSRPRPRRKGLGMPAPEPRATRGPARRPGPSQRRAVRARRDLVGHVDTLGGHLPQRTGRRHADTDHGLDRLLGGRLVRLVWWGCRRLVCGGDGDHQDDGEGRQRHPPETTTHSSLLTTQRADRESVGKRKSATSVRARAPLDGWSSRALRRQGVREMRTPRTWSWRESNPRPLAMNQVFSGRSLSRRFSQPQHSDRHVADRLSRCRCPGQTPRPGLTSKPPQ
jgi:hypothetical protein